MVRRVLIIVTLGIVALAVAAFFLYPLYAAARWAPDLRTAARNADRLVIKTGGPCHPDPDTDVVRLA